MSTFLALLALLLPIAVTVNALVLASLSQRLGAVTNRAPIYRWFYVAAVLSSLSAAIYLWTLAEGQMGSSDGRGVTAITYALPLMLAISICALVASRYWAWLLYARDM